MDIFSAFVMIFALSVFLSVHKLNFADSRKLADKKRHSFSTSIPIFDNKEKVENIIRNYLVDFGYNLKIISENKMVFDLKSTLAKTGNWIVVEKSQDQFVLKLYFKYRNNIIRSDFNTTIVRPINYLIDREVSKADTKKGEQ